MPCRFLKQEGHRGGLYNPLKEPPFAGTRRVAGGHGSVSGKKATMSGRESEREIVHAAMLGEDKEMTKSVILSRKHRGQPGHLPHPEERSVCRGNEGKHKSA